MPIDTRGWIEYSVFPSQEERKEEHAWIHWMNITSVIDTVDEITELLFGYSKRIIRGEYQTEAVAKDRGIPINCSDIVKLEMQKVKEFEEKYGTGEIFGYTTIYYNEIKALNSIRKINEGDWFNLFELTEKFKQIRHLKEEQIRLIVWFDW